MPAPYELTDRPDMICRASDGAMIPTDPANGDYRDFLVWQALPNNAPDPYVPPVLPKPTIITPTQFLNRFPPGVVQTLAQTPSTLVLLITLAAATQIDLTDPAVAAGINGLVPTILTMGQAAAVLDH